MEFNPLLTERDSINQLRVSTAELTSDATRPLIEKSEG
jgi:hypothetical protein